jgi:hypothetical protein
MKTSTRRTILCLCLCLPGGALPAAAAASEPIRVAPLGAASAGESGVSGAGGGSGCRSRNVIDFREGAPGNHEVRHFGKIDCEAPLRRSECVARLFEVVGDTPTEISEEQDVGRRMCGYDSGFFGSYAAGDEFSERYTYKLTLRRGFVWQKPAGDFCRRKNERRELVCSDSHQTVAPVREADVHTS